VYVRVLFDLDQIISRQPTGLVIASHDMALATRIAATLSGDTRVRVWVVADVVGVEVGGALKNIYAIGAGIVEGAGFGYNPTALLVTRGCSEMKRMAVALGAQPATLAGLSGIGDLMLTCFGPASRNRSVGVRIGKGESLADITASMNEGTTPAILKPPPAISFTRTLAFTTLCCFGSCGGRPHHIGCQNVGAKIGPGAPIAGSHLLDGARPWQDRRGLARPHERSHRGELMLAFN
jgi:hypothetical protein